MAGREFCSVKGTGLRLGSTCISSVVVLVEAVGGQPSRHFFFFFLISGGGGVCKKLSPQVGGTTKCFPVLVLV